MANEIGTATVVIESDVKDLKKGFDVASNDIKGFGIKAAAGIAVAAAALGAFLKASITSAAEAETSQNHLALALKNVGSSSKAALQEHLEYAKALQSSTAFSDEQIQSALTLGLQFNKTGAELKKMTGLAADMAAATGGTLQEAMQALTQATLGNFRGLRQYGVTIDDSIKKTKGFSIAQEELSLKFKGAAAEELKTYAGQLKALGNQWDEVKELVGGFLIPHMTKWMGQLKIVIEDGLPLLVKNIKIFGISAEIAFLQAINKLGIFDGKIQSLYKRINEISVEQLHNDKLEITSDEKKADTKIKNSLRTLEVKKYAAETEAKMDKWLADKGKEIADHKAKEDDKRARDLAKRTESYSAAMRRRIEDDTTSWGNYFADMTMNIRDAFASSVAQMIVHGGNFRDAMKQIGQQILQEFIEQVIKKMIMEWMVMMGFMAATGGGGGGGFFGGAAGAGGVAGAGGAAPAGGGFFGGMGLIPGVGALAAGGAAASMISQWGQDKGGTLGGILANPIGYQINFAKKFISSPGKTIKSVGKKIKKAFSGGVLSEPTMMMGMKSGQFGIAGEDGPEALTSFKEMGLTPEGGRNRLRGGGGGGGGGGGIHLHVHGTFIEGDQAKWQRLLQKTIVPEIRKYSMNSSRSPFNRSRGAPG